ncbi:MAG: hypothetical protein R6V32_03245 [Bacteroidales bacterium]
MKANPGRLLEVIDRYSGIVPEHENSSRKVGTRIGKITVSFFYWGSEKAAHFENIVKLNLTALLLSLFIHN